MVKAELGIKRVCPSCTTRFYDLTKRPIECPKCGFSFEPESLYKQRRSRVPEAAVVAPIVSDDDEDEEEENEETEAEIVEPIADEAPVIMTDDDDEVVEEEPEPESAGMSVVDADEDGELGDIAVDDDEAEEDDSLLESVDDDDDVTDIIDPDLAKDER